MKTCQILVITSLLTLLSYTNCISSHRREHQCPIIGIDLGTTHSVVAGFKNGIVEIIPNDLGDKITLSAVSFTDEGRFFGETDKNQTLLNPSTTIYGVKRLIGRKYKDKEVQNEKIFLSYEIVDRDGKPYIKTTINTPEKLEPTTKLFSPEEIFGMMLTKMKQIAENYLETKVENVIVTVPSHFNDVQRRAIIDAGRIGELNVVRVLNEPSAAVLAYEFDKSKSIKNVLVFDLGGGTFDVSIVNIDNGVFEILGTSGDTYLGGEDFNQRVLSYFITVIQRKYGQDISNNKKAVLKLKTEIEKAKRDLSSFLEVKIEIPDLLEEKEFSETLTRQQFEDLNSDLFEKLLGHIKTTLHYASMNKEQIDEIILVGGSTRVPKVQKLIEEFFEGKEPNRGINPEEAVAYGAAILGAILCGDINESDNVIILDRTSLSLGVETEGGMMSTIIPRGTLIPTRRSQVFTTHKDFQSSITIQVYEGERALAKDNHLLGVFNLNGVVPGPKGIPQIEAIFDIDVDCVLRVTAVDKMPGRPEPITITSIRDNLSMEEIQSKANKRSDNVILVGMIEEAKKFSEYDKIFKERRATKNRLESYIYSIRNAIEDPEQFANVINEIDKEKVKETALEAQKWLETKKLASKEELEEYEKELRGTLNNIMTKTYKESSVIKFEENIEL